MTIDELIPMLTVRDAASAADFYRRALGAEEISRTAAPTGQLVIELTVRGHRFYAVDENPSAFNVSPGSLGGTTGPLCTTSWPLRAKKPKKALRSSAAVRVDMRGRHLARPTSPGDHASQSRDQGSLAPPAFPFSPPPPNP